MGIKAVRQMLEDNKGAAEAVLEACTRMIDKHAEAFLTAELTETNIDHIKAVLDNYVYWNRKFDQTRNDLFELKHLLQAVEAPE